MDPILGSTLAAATLGFLLGIRHALDADHVVAVSTIISQERKALRGIWVGASWGLGHTTPLLILGLLILGLKESFVENVDDVAPYFEFGVGLMLVFLGLQVLWRLRKRRLHAHEHTAAAKPHVHIHAHSRDEETAGRPSETHHFAGRFRLKSYLIGVVHGMAGSAAVMLLLLPRAPTFGAGVTYILVFGLGTILAMAGITIALGLPFAAASGTPAVRDWIARVAAVLSCVVGLAIMIEITSGYVLLPFLP